MMARMKTDYDKDFLKKNVRMFGSKIDDIFQKCCCIVDFSQENQFYHLIRANYTINVGTIL